MNKQNLADQVYNRILTMLYRGGVSSLEVLSDASLAESLGVSRTPVRIALARLESEGMIRKLPGRGWSTVRPTIEDLEQIFDLKELLEAHAARKAAENIDPTDAAELLAVMAEMEQASANLDVEAEMAADAHYHEVLRRIAGNARLDWFIKILDSQWYQLRRGYIALQDGMKLSCQEHRLITDAVVAGDADLAAERALQHHRRVRATIMNIMTHVLMPFFGEHAFDGSPDERAPTAKEHSSNSRATGPAAWMP